MTTTQEHFAHVLKHGLSRTNRFQVLIPLPQKLQSAFATSVKDKSKLAQWFSEAVKIIKIFSGGSSNEITRGLDIMCSQTELPGKTINVSETKYNGDVHKMGHSTLYGNQQFVFKVSKDMHEKNIIDEWMKLVINPKTHEVGYLFDYGVDVTINQLDTADNIVHSVVLEDAFPVMSNPMTLSNLESNNVHELSVQFAYRRWYSVETETEESGLITSLSQTPFGPYLTPILSNPVIQKGLEYIEGSTGIDLDGEAANIFNQVDTIVKNTTGESINKSVTLLNTIKSTLGLNQNLTPTQITQLIELVEGTTDRLTG